MQERPSSIYEVVNASLAADSTRSRRCLFRGHPTPARTRRRRIAAELCESKTSGRALCAMSDRPSRDPQTLRLTASTLAIDW